MNFYLLDSRAGIIAAQHPEGKLIDEDKGRYILTVGTLKECCRDANNGSYGDFNVVSDDQYNILWEIMNDHGHWIYKNYKPNELHNNQTP